MTNDNVPLKAAIAKMRAELATNAAMLKVVEEMEEYALTLEERTVGRTRVGAVVVSTVYTGRDGYGGKEWETLVFTSRIDPFSGEEAIGTHHEESRYYSEDEAKAGHDAMVEKWEAA